MSDQPNGRDIVAVFNFYNGDVVERRYAAYHDWIPNGIDGQTDWIPVDGNHQLYKCLTEQFIFLENGLIRQTKDIEKVVWNYC